MSMATLSHITNTLFVRPKQGRRIIAIAGAPASGKSSLAKELCSYINDQALGQAALLPMDGYHYDDILLHKLARHARKGAPDTFDVGGLKHMIERLIRNAEDEVIVPVFDRDIEIARAGASVIVKECDVVIVEGNYLLIDQAPWASLHGLFDLTILLDVPIDILKQRLRQRWVDLDYDEPGILRKLNEVDLPNGEFIRRHSRPADLVIS